MPTLTKKQSQVLQFIRSFLDREGYAPSYREIASTFSLASPATAYQHVQALVEKGVLASSHDGLARSIELVETPEAMPSSSRAITFLPLAGLITAGAPIEAIEGNETMAVPSDFVNQNESSYVLRVRGNSMIEDGILDGDFVIVERNHYPKNGDVVVALLDNTYATLKRFYREERRIRLQPANRTMKPIYVRDLIVQGIVRAVIRKFQTV
jgi:repressor LexA